MSHLFSANAAPHHTEQPMWAWENFAEVAEEILPK